MKLCLVGKYPPIQGGVSTTTYWIARGLAARGHEVHVVTNAPEVEPIFRADLDAADERWLEPEFHGAGGRVVVHASAQFDSRALSHIPLANPFVSKLAGLATEVIELHGCVAVLAYYLEPYAVAGWLAAKWTGRPLIVKHAGSDLDRLMRVPELATTYKQILRSADAVVTQRGLMARFTGIGVGRDRLEVDPGFAVPVEVFNPAAEPITLDGLDGVDRDNRPSIGIYGKIGPSKGTYDLVAALGGLAADGLDFNLLAMIGAAQAEWLAPALREAGLAQRTRILPLVAHWRVPGFIRACTAVCFLERDFSVAIHGPMVPREILACGTCLVVSGEIVAKQVSREQYRTGENVVIVEDPKDHDALKAALRPLIVDAGLAREIGRRGHDLSIGIEPASVFAERWEELLERRAAGRGAAAIEAPAGGDLLAPLLRGLVERDWPELAGELDGLAPGHDPFSVAIGWCDRAHERSAGSPAGERRAKLEAALDYQRLRLAATSERAHGPRPAFATPDRLRSRAYSDPAVLDLVPVTGNDVRVVEFAYDVSALFTGELDETASDSVSDPLDRVRAEALQVVFQRSPQLVARELRIDSATQELLERCDGVNSTRDIVRAMAHWFGVGAEPESEALVGGVLEALGRLHAADVIVFGAGRSGGETVGQGPAEQGPTTKSSASQLDGSRLP